MPDFAEPADPCSWVERVIADAAADAISAGTAQVTVDRADLSADDGPPAFEVALEPKRDDACPLRLTFDGLRPMYMSLGAQGAGNEIWTGSVSELERFLTSAVLAVVSGRYRELEVARPFRSSRLEGRLELGDGQTDHFAVPRGEPRQYRPY
ncbi:MAG: hypothetical protein ACEQSX_10075 [Baekduiaceae bacterium]